MSRWRKSLELPDECWELIFNRLGVHYHFDVISLVNKHLFSVCSRLKRTLTIYNPSIRIHCNLSKFFHRFYNLSRIDFKCFMTRYEFRAILVDVSRSGLDLEELYIWNWVGVDVVKESGLSIKNLMTFKCEFSVLMFRDLVDIASLVPNLEEFDIGLGGSDVTDDGIKMLANKVKQLRRVNLLRYQRVTDESLIVLSSNCKFLNELIIGCIDGGSRLSEEGIGFALRNCKKMTSLILHGIKTNDHSKYSTPTQLFSIANSMSYAKTLCEIEFRYMNVSDDLLCSIANSCITLKKLGLWCCKNFSYVGIAFLLQECQTINQLRLGNVLFLTDSVVRDLSMYLGKFTHLEIWSSSLLSDQTFFTLSKNCPFLVQLKLESLCLGQGEKLGLGQTENRYITSLEMRDNIYLNDDSLSRFGLICPNLLLLNLKGCSKITEKGIGKILVSCPKLTHLEVDSCQGRMILGTGSKLSKLNLAVLRVSNTNIDDRGMALIGKRCPKVLKLELKFCMEVTIQGLKEVLTNCVKLREINLWSCHKVGLNIVPWMIHTRPSLKKICPPGGDFSETDQKNLIRRHGCVVCND